MIFLVGRWDLLPEEWEGINGLYEKSEDDIRKEVFRQMDLSADKYIGGYTMEEFEETFNGDNEGDFNGTNYFIKIF